MLSATRAQGSGMTEKRVTMADQSSTRAALYGAITDEIANLPKVSNTVLRAKAIADLSLAYRYVAGGDQPGSTSVHVDK